MATILLVDDRPDNLEIYRILLVHVGYAVLLAADGAAGVRMAKEHIPDLIVMDVSMPVMDGFEATRTLRADPTTKDICIIGLTAHAMPSDRAMVLAAGFDAYFSKPLEPRRLLEEVKKLIELRTGPAAGAALPQ